jgi:hypothetical protein
MLVRPMVQGDAPISRMVLPGDVVAGGESMGSGDITTAGAGTWTGAAIAKGILNRTGPGAGYTDTTDTSTNIIAALVGSTPQQQGFGVGAAGIDVVSGTSFRFLFQNTVAFAMTFAAGVGVVAGNGTLNCAASLWREYLVTVVNATPQTIINCATTNASAVVTFNLQTGQTSLPMGTVTPGMTVSGTGITAGTTVIGVTQGVGGITGVTLSANATATNNPVALTFLPTVRFDGLRSGTA